MKGFVVNSIVINLLDFVFFFLLFFFNKGNIFSVIFEYQDDPVLKWLMNINLIYHIWMDIFVIRLQKTLRKTLK